MEDLRTWMRAGCFVDQDFDRPTLLPANPWVGAKHLDEHHNIGLVNWGDASPVRLIGND